MGSLYICPTPIGNLDDISKRVIDTLSSVDFIYCEDTRRAGKLVSKFGIDTPLKSFFLGNEHSKNDEILSLLKEGKDIALISDAGTPLISDPGSELILDLVNNDLNVISLPGPSSILPALTVSGFNINEFQFLGFIPKSGKERELYMQKLVSSKITSVCFTSPKRLKKDLSFFCENDFKNNIVVCREISKKFETIYRGNAKALLQILPEDIKGEITIVVEGTPSNKTRDFDLEKTLKILTNSNLSKKDISKAVSEISNYSSNEIYDLIKDL
jgi:16S rRNA (cytidine1402-2'-O)-methyltransferase